MSTRTAPLFPFTTRFRSRVCFSVDGRAKRGAGGGEAPKRGCFPCLSAFAVRSYPQVGLARVGVNIGYRICVTGLEVASKPLNIRLFSSQSVGKTPNIGG